MALKDPSLYPILHVMKQSMSIKWVTVELVMIIALVLFAVSTSREPSERGIYANVKQERLLCDRGVARHVCLCP